MLQIGGRVLLCKLSKRVLIGQKPFTPAFKLMQSGCLVH